MPAYSEIIVDHFENPRNLGEIESPHLAVRIGDPVCGDTLHLTALRDDKRITAVRFHAYGCAPSVALGSVLTELLMGIERDRLDTVDEPTIMRLLGGLAPNQEHVSMLGMRVVRSFRDAWRQAE